MLILYNHSLLSNHFSRLSYQRFDISFLKYRTKPICNFVWPTESIMSGRIKLLGSFTNDTEIALSNFVFTIKSNKNKFSSFSSSRLPFLSYKEIKSKRRSSSASKLKRFSCIKASQCCIESIIHL